MSRLIRYFCVGGACFLVDFGLFFWLAKVAGYHYLLVNVLSFSVATACNYLLCIKFVFKSGVRYGKKIEFILIFAVSGLSLAINQLLLYTFVNVLVLEILTAKAVAVILTFLLNYCGRSFFVFKHKKEQTCD